MAEPGHVAKAWELGQGRGGGAKIVAKGLVAWPMPRERGKGCGVRSRPWRCGQGRAGGAKIAAKGVGAWPRPWERGQGRGSVAKAVGVWPRPWWRGKIMGVCRRPWGHCLLCTVKAWLHCILN